MKCIYPIHDLASRMQVFVVLCSGYAQAADYISAFDNNYDQIASCSAVKQAIAT